MCIASGHNPAPPPSSFSNPSGHKPCDPKAAHATERKSSCCTGFSPRSPRLLCRSQSFSASEGRAPWGKMQSIFALVRYFGGSEPLGWAFQWTMIAAVAAALVVVWRSRVRYSLKAAALATGTLLVTPYLFLYDVMVLAIAVGFLVRIGLGDGFHRYELPALGGVAFLLMFYPLFGAPTGFGATLIVAVLIARRCLMPHTRTAPSVSPINVGQFQT